MCNIRATNQRISTHVKPQSNAVKFFVEAPGLRLGLSKQRVCHEFPQKTKLSDLMTALKLPANEYLFQLSGKPLCNEQTLSEARVQPY